MNKSIVSVRGGVQNNIALGPLFGTVSPKSFDMAILIGLHGTAIVKTMFIYVTMHA